MISIVGGGCAERKSGRGLKASEEARRISEWIGGGSKDLTFLYAFFAFREFPYHIVSIDL
jgi:hypothetical protein